MPAYSREAPAQRAEERILSLQMWKVVPPIGMGGEKLAGGRPTELQPPSVGLGGTPARSAFAAPVQGRDTLWFVHHFAATGRGGPHL